MKYWMGPVSSADQMLFLMRKQECAVVKTNIFSTNRLKLALNAQIIVYNVIKLRNVLNVKLIILLEQRVTVSQQFVKIASISILNYISAKIVILLVQHAQKMEQNVNLVQMDCR